MFKISKDTPFSSELLLRLVNKHRSGPLTRLQKLKKYYFADNEIHCRVYTDPLKPHNKVANGYGNYITNTLVGYFIGNPVTYGGDDSLLEYIHDILEYNDEADENMELAKAASIYGVAYERLYMDEDGQLRFHIMPTEDCIPVYDDSLVSDLLYFIRYEVCDDILTDTRSYMIEVLDSQYCRTYKADDSLTVLTLVDEQPHYFGMVPVAIFKNNEEEIGDFELVIDLIDAYDKLQSDTMNESEYHADSYLAFSGYAFDLEDEDGKRQFSNMKEQKVWFLDEGTDVKFIERSGNDTSNENNKNRFDNDIHKFSFCPNMSDEEFASNASGIAIKFKTLGTENITAVKERKFKKGLQMRFELMSMITGILNSNFDWRDIDIIFSRNLPTNDADTANMVKTLDGIVSKETLLAQIPFVEDVQAELDRLEEEKESNPFTQQLMMYNGMASNSDDGSKQEEEGEEDEVAANNH